MNTTLACELLEWLRKDLSDEEKWARFEAWMDGLTDDELDLVGLLLDDISEAAEVKAA